jgi:hypothetical protein
MSGRQPNRCRCVYDNPDKFIRRRQGNLNKDLEQQWRQVSNARVREAYLRLQSGQPSQAPPPVDVFNEAMFLRPIA